MKRRDFLHKTSHAAAVSGVLSQLPFGLQKNLGLKNLIENAIETDHVLVLIFLNGGNDGLNTVVPLNYMSELNALRSNVVLPENQLLKLDGVDNIGIHPRLDYYQEMYNEGKLQIIQNVGYDQPNFSHFRSTDIWLSGSDSDEIINSGWAGRYLDFEYPGYPMDYPNTEVPYPLAVEQGYGSSLLFQGPGANMGIVVQDTRDFYRLIANNPEPGPATNAGDKLDHVRLIQIQSQEYGQVVKEAADKVSSQGNYPGSQLASELKIVARLIAGGLGTRLYLVQHGGFDTHDNQVDQGNRFFGTHGGLLSELNEATRAFMQDLEGLGVADRVMGMTFSEFGRRVVSNASGGTDHGTAAPLFIFGNKVMGGITGENPVLDSQMTYEDNLPHEFDFRQVYASVLEQWLCVDKMDIDNILGGGFDPIMIAPDSDCFISTNSRKLTQNAGKVMIQVHPNPLNGMARIEYESHGDHIQIDWLDGQGRVIQNILSRKMPKGKHEMNWATGHLPPGRYVCRIRTSKYVQARTLVKK